MSNRNKSLDELIKERDAFLKNNPKLKSQQELYEKKILKIAPEDVDPKIFSTDIKGKKPEPSI